MNFMEVENELNKRPVDLRSLARRLAETVLPSHLLRKGLNADTAVLHLCLTLEQDESAVGDAVRNMVKS